MRKLGHVLTFLVLIGCCLVIGVDRGSTETLPPDAWLFPFDINIRDHPLPNPNPPIPVITQKEVYEFIWWSFIALNWPHKAGGVRGQPDTGKSLAPWNGPSGVSEGPVVWETYRRPDQVFLPREPWPLSWNEDRPPQVCPKRRGPQIKVLNVNHTNYSENADSVNQPFTQAHYPTGPLYDQNKEFLRHEVTLNQSYFSLYQVLQIPSARKANTSC